MQVVGSVDELGMRYAAVNSFQPHGTEFINEKEMARMTKQLLQFYFEKNKTYPQHIVFFRDGVGESSYSKVLNLLLSCILLQAKF